MELVNQKDRYGGPRAEGWRTSVYQVIFKSHTPAGRLFDKVLISAILLSVIIIMLDSEPALHARWSKQFALMEWGFTIVFTAEYILRVVCLRRPLKYITNFYGVIDLLAILPLYLALFFPGLHVLINVRALRLIRIFRIFKLTRYMSEFYTLKIVLLASTRKILVFVTVVMMVVIVLGSVIYVVEGNQNGFTSIPTAIYWAVTTITTVGYGDLAPITEAGRIVASIIMLLGWGMIAVPTGMITAEFALRQGLERRSVKECGTCGADIRPSDARYCARCGTRVAEKQPHIHETHGPEDGGSGDIPPPSQTTPGDS